METLPRQPAEEKQGRPTMLLRKRKRLEENDKKSGKSRSVWKSLWGSYAAGTGAFLMCGHHFVQHEEDVGAHLPSLLHSGFPQKVRVNVKNVFLLCKGLKSPAIKGVSELSYDWKCLFSPVWQNFGENMTFVSFHSGHVVMMLFLKLQILCKAGYCSTFVCVSKAYNFNFFLLQFFLVILVIRTPGAPLRN